MSGKTGVDWADSAWPVTTGCTKVSLGCDNCYALRGSWRMSHNPNPKVREAYEGTAAKREDGTLDWTGAVRECHNRLDWPGKWRKPKRVFVCSMSDLFHTDVSSEFINDVWRRMHIESRHTYLLLTKRPEKLEQWTRETIARYRLIVDMCWPNWMWLGVTAEDQQRADERIPILLSVPAAVKWISAEPLLGPLDLSTALSLPSKCVHCGGVRIWDSWPSADGTPANYKGEQGLDALCLSCGTRGAWDNYKPQPPLLQWVVIGCETGPNARPAKREWVTDLIDQCRAAGVKVFVKDNIPNGWLEPYGVSHLREYPEVKE